MDVLTALPRVPGYEVKAELADAIAEALVNENIVRSAEVMTDRYAHRVAITLGDGREFRADIVRVYTEDEE